jgi:acyl-CoA reductase-like NAD-dependent aldehyde dehydrogenase
MPSTNQTDAPTGSREPFVPAAPYELVIGGETVAAGDGFEAIDPSSGQAWATIPQAGEAEVNAAVAAARAAGKEWGRTSAEVRQAMLWALADAVEAEPERWARLLATENGRPIREALLADVPTCAGILRFFSGVTRAHHGQQIPVERADSLIYTTREPLGVIAALIPWNSPIITLANKIGPALAAGNTVVLKPSEFASASVIEFARMAQEILPPGVLNVVTGFGPEVGAALVAHPDVAKITFTGGTSTARAIMSAAGQALTPCLMELGGKGAMIVCDDADIEAAAADALTGIYMANGEVCVAASRLLVQAGVHEQFRETFLATAEKIRVGDALDPSTEFGPLVSAAQRDRVAGCVDRARGEGAAVALGGERLDLGGDLADGFFYAPTVLGDERGTTSASSEEVFGPVTVIERFDEVDDAVARANATRYGLAAGVWTSDLARAHTVARDLDAGIIWVNKWFDLPVGMPMGGVKDSGFGRELSAETLLEYSAPKVVDVDLSTSRPPLFGAS